MLAIRTILHPTDFSERSAYALHLAGSLARDHGARLLVLHVVPPPAVGYTETFIEPPIEVDKRTMTERLCHVKPSDPKVPVEHLLEEGDPADEIIHMAKANRCDLIVMGTHGRTGFGRLVLGSVAEEVVRKAPCPVLTVRGPLQEAGGQRTAQEKVATS